MSEDEVPGEDPELPVVTAKFNVVPSPVRWQFTPTELDDDEGNKVVFVMAAFTAFNSSQVYWITPDQLDDFLRDAQLAIITAKNRIMAKNPLVVADQNGLEQTIAGMKVANRNMLRPPGE